MATLSLPPPAKAQKYIEYSMENELRGFNSSVKVPTLKLVTVDRVDGKGVVVYRFKSEKHLDNNYGTVHGAAYCAFVDIFASSCMRLHSTLEKGSPWSEPGYSQNLQILYHHSIPIGAWVEVENTVVSVGKSLAVVQSNIYLIDGPNGGRIEKAASSSLTKINTVTSMMKQKSKI